jgi:hypothetical protein
MTSQGFYWSDGFLALSPVWPTILGKAMALSVTLVREGLIGATA